MGTNFYTRSKKCKCCGSEIGVYHLGKSSIGWTFALQANGYRFYKNWSEMKMWLKDKKIKDEYGRSVSLKSFISWVENRKDIPDPEEVQWDSRVKKIGGYTFVDYEFS